MREAQSHPGHEREVLDFYQKNPEAVSRLQAPIFEDKVVDFMVALAQVTEREVKPADLQAELEEPVSAAKPGAEKKKAGSKSAPREKTAAKGKGEAKGS